MKHKLLLICLLLAIVLPKTLLATKVSSLCADAELRSEPSSSACLLQTIAAGQTVSILESGLPDFWVKVETADGSVGYMDSGVLDFPNGIEPAAPKTAAAATAQIESGSPGIAAPKVQKQRIVPRDGAYQIIRRGVVVHVGKPYSDVKDENMYRLNDIIAGAKYVDKKWISFTMADGQTGYVATRFLHKLKLHELIELVGEDSELVAAEQALIGQIPGYSVFNGWKSGRYGVWIIMTALLGLIVLSFTTFNGEKAQPKRVARYGGLLMLISLLEIWYLLSMGMEDMAWFLGDAAGKYGLVNFGMLLAATAVQCFGIYLYSNGVQETHGFGFSLRWALGGLLFPMLLIGLWYLGNHAEGFETHLILCAVLCQIPQLIVIIVAHFRQVPRKQRRSIAGALFTYWIATIGAVCMAAMSIGMVIVLVIGIILMFVLAKNLPGMMYCAAQETLEDTARTGKYTGAISLLETQAEHGTLDPQEAARRIRELKNRMNNGQKFPDNLDNI